MTDIARVRASRQTYIGRVAIAGDRFLNALTGGRDGETISQRFGRWQAQGWWAACLFCRILDVVIEPDHCARSLVEDGTVWTGDPLPPTQGG